MPNPGTYSANVSDWGLSVTKNDDPQIVVRLAMETGESISWFGSLKEGEAIRITMETLIKMGFDIFFNGNGKDLETKLLKEDALDKSKTIKVNLVNETWDGVERIKIKSIQDPSDLGVRELSATGSQKLAGINLAPIMAKIREKKGIKNAEGIPF